MTETPAIPRPTGRLIPDMPPLLPGSPEVVKVFDRIRRALDDRDEFAEFCWFAREYPRCYRFHFNGAEFRLDSLHRIMSKLHDRLMKEAETMSGGCFEHGVSDRSVEQVYWDFESFLSEVNIALDLLARVVGPAFRQQTPPSFNKLCKSAIEHPVIEILRKAQNRWVDRLKDYRDCFTHYTPVDTLLLVSLRYYPSGWQLRARLPINPNVREILGFKFSRKTELLGYALRTYANLRALDRAVASQIWKLFRAGEFPQRHEHLFFLGTRHRKSVSVG